MELEARFSSPVLDIASNPFLFFPFFPVLLSLPSLPLPSSPSMIFRKDLIIKSKIASDLSSSHLRFLSAGPRYFFVLFLAAFCVLKFRPQIRQRVPVYSFL